MGRKGEPPPIKGNGQGYLWLKALLDYQGDDCKPWPFCTDARIGRGRVGYNGKRYWAHRLMCLLAHGEPPTPKHQAAHECGKGHYGCCNPRHLKWKTNSENQLDRRRNGNMLRNRNGNKPTLTEVQISELISLKGKMTQMGMAAKFGVSLGCVQYWLKYRETRGHSEGKVPHWTTEQEEILRDGISLGIPAAQLAEEIGKTPRALYTKAQRMGLFSNGDRR
jgi:hypothetical protein